MAKTRSSKGSFKDYLNQKNQLTSTNIPLIALYGSSEILIESALDDLRNLAKKKSVEITTLEGTTLTEATLDAIVNQTSLFDPVTFYIVRRAEQAKNLAKLLKNISVQYVSKNWTHRLILIWTGGSPSAAVAGELKRLQTFMLPCMEPWPNEIPQVLQMYAANLGLKLSPDAIQLMIEANGSDLIKHRHEINKFSLMWRHEKASLTRQDIGPLLGILREDDAFQLDRLLIQGHWHEAQALLKSLLDRGEKAVGILSILANHCRNVLRINDAMTRGHQLPTLAEETKLPIFILKNYLPMAGRVDTYRYSRALEMCCQADVALKSKPIAEALLVSRVIEALTPPR